MITFIKFYRAILILPLVINISTALAQKPKDTLIYNLPVVNGKLIYEGHGSAKGRDKAAIDTIAKSWLYSYFKANQLSDDKAIITPSGSYASGFLLNHGILEYKVKPGMINIQFVAVINLKISCANNYYSYRIDSIYFRPKNNTLNAVGYQNNPEYLIAMYKKKHLGFMTAWEVTRGQIREYLAKMNTAVRDCIASLNKAMEN